VATGGELCTTAPTVVGSPTTSTDGRSAER
jgi:hypothetical protein